MHGGFEVKLNSFINILRYFKMVIKTAGVLRAKRCVVCKIEAIEEVQQI